jgi:hypothetical protein
MIEFKNNKDIFEKLIRCVIEPNEFNYSTNPTILIDNNGSVNSIFLENTFSPYFTTIGLYNDSNELLAVAKLSQPLQIPTNIKLNIEIKIEM